MKVINVLTIQKQYHCLHEAAYLLASAKNHQPDKGDKGSGEETDLEAGIYSFLLYRHECFTGKYTTRKIHKNYIRDPCGLFSIISHVSL